VGYQYAVFSGKQNQQLFVGFTAFEYRFIGYHLIGDMMDGHITTSQEVFPSIDGRYRRK
jgi:hypothetical protein